MAAQGSVLALALVTALALPFQWWGSHRFIEPHVKFYDIANSQQTDFVLIDSEPTSHAIDEVRNLPDLSNSPLLFSSREMDRAMVSELCNRGTLAILTRADFPRADFLYEVPIHSSAFVEKAKVIRGRDCVRPVVR